MSAIWHSVIVVTHRKQNNSQSFTATTTNYLYLLRAFTRLNSLNGEMSFSLHSSPILERCAAHNRSITRITYAMKTYRLHHTHPINANHFNRSIFLDGFRSYCLRWSMKSSRLPFPFLSSATFLVYVVRQGGSYPNGYKYMFEDV